MNNFPNKPTFNNVINLLGAILSVGVPAEAAEPGAELAKDGVLGKLDQPELVTPSWKWCDVNGIP